MTVGAVSQRKSLRQTLCQTSVWAYWSSMHTLNTSTLAPNLPYFHYQCSVTIANSGAMAAEALNAARTYPAFDAVQHNHTGRTTYDTSASARTLRGPHWPVYVSLLTAVVMRLIAVCDVVGSRRIVRKARLLLAFLLLILALALRFLLLCLSPRLCASLVHVCRVAGPVTRRLHCDVFLHRATAVLRRVATRCASSRRMHGM